MNDRPDNAWIEAEQRRRGKLSQQQLFIEALPIVQAVADGKEVEELYLHIACENGWRKPSGDNIAPLAPTYIYRIKPESPAPKYIPWTIDTAPGQPIWVRMKDYNDRRLVLKYTKEAVITASSMYVPYNVLLADYLYADATFNILVWRPCGTLDTNTNTNTNENKT